MATRTGAKRHTHKYYKFDGLWHCALERCTHFMPLNVSHQVEGKLTICWECGREMTLSKLAMENAQPICPGCAMGVDEEGLAAYLEKKGL